MNRNLYKQLADWDALRRQLESPSIDPQTLFDTLDGETELTDALLAVADEVDERESTAAALGERIKRLTERKSRMEKGAETLRQSIVMAISSADIKETIKGDACTLTVSSTAPKLDVVEESAIPSTYWAPQDPKLDKKALTQALRDGAEIPGAKLTNGGLKLTIRRF